MSRHMPRLLSLLTASCIVTAVPLQRLRGSFPAARFFHSDIAFLPTLFGDVAGRGRITDWSLPEAPYFWPDWPLYFLAWSISPNYSTAVAVFAFAQVSLLALTWVLLVRELMPSLGSATSALSGLLVLVIAALLGQMPASYLTVSFARFGTLITAMIGLCIFTKALRPENQPLLGDRLSARRDRTLPLAQLALVAIAVPSDRLILTWLVLPLIVIAIVALAASGRRGFSDRVPSLEPQKALLSQLGALAGGTVVGLGVGRLLNDASTRYQVAAPAAEIPLSHRVDLVYRSIFEGFVMEGWPAFSWLVFASIGLWLVQLWRHRNFGGLILISLWFALATFLTLAAEATTFNPTHRYHQFIYHLPILMLGIWPALEMQRQGRVEVGLLPLLRRKASISAPVAVAVIAVGTAVAAASPIEQLSLGHRSDEIACLDAQLKKSGSREGIGNYAVARLAVVESQFTLEVGARNSRMLPETDVHNVNWGRTSADFAILKPSIFGRINPRVLQAFATRRPTAVPCGEWIVYDYGPDGLDLDRLQADGGRIYIPGCWFQQQMTEPPVVLAFRTVEEQGPDCTFNLSASQVDDETPAELVFQDAFPIGSASYRVTLDLASEESAKGVLRVTTWKDTTRPTSTTIVRLPEVQAFPIEIEVPPGEEVRSIRVRLSYAGGSDLTIKSLAIERLG